MSRLLRFFTLLFLICLVIFIYFIFLAEQEQETWLINDGDILIPNGEQEKLIPENYKNVKTSYLAVSGILLLLYLKIIWKLITLKWGISEEREGKRRMLG